MDRLGIPERLGGRGRLPVVNVPKIEMGIASLDEKRDPQFTLSPEARELYAEWGLPPAKVEDTGQVAEPPTTADIPSGIPLVSCCDW